MQARAGFLYLQPRAVPHDILDIAMPKTPLFFGLFYKGFSTSFPSTSGDEKGQDSCHGKS
jgi:hypothetical protein